MILTMRLRVAFVALVVGTALGAPAAADAQQVGQDTVVGTAWDCLNADTCAPEAGATAFTSVTANARSGPAGQAPAGTVTWIERSLGSYVTGEARVSCLSVTDRLAIVGVAGMATYHRLGITVPITGFMRVTDGGGPASAQDTFELDIRVPVPPAPLPPAPADCSAFPAGRLLLRNDGGDLVVTDARTPPTTKQECKHGGWQRFGFGNRAQCVRSVRQGARQACIFERVAHGVPAFRARYGTPRHLLHAMRRCIRTRIGS